MEQIRTFSDERLDGVCAYCGKLSDTGDHVPSRVLLDDPLPENLPKVPCCYACNQSFSLDEEYFACLIECIVSGSADVRRLGREKIKRILTNRESLRQRIVNSMGHEHGQIVFAVEEERIKNVLLKLARGHVKFENSESELDEPSTYFVKPFHMMDDSELEIFFSQGTMEKMPEVGSRAMTLLIEHDGQVMARWITVQKDRYEYQVAVSANLRTVKINISNFLAIEIAWE